MVIKPTASSWQTPVVHSATQTGNGPSQSWRTVRLKSFDVGILLRISWLDIAQGYPLPVSPIV